MTIGSSEPKRVDRALTLALLVALGALDPACHHKTSSGSGSGGVSQGGTAGYGGDGFGAAGPSGAAGGTLVAASGAEDAGASSKPSGDFRSDPDAWAPVDTLAGCSTLVARDPKSTWPGLAWSDCGAGCRESKLLPVDAASLAATLGTGARVVNGVLHVSLSMRTEGDLTRYVLGSFSYGDGSADALVREEGSCIAQLAGRGAPGTLRILPRQGDFQYRVGELDFSTRSLAWLSPPLTTMVDAFDFEGGWGGVQAFTDLLVAADPTNTTLSSVYTSSGLLFYPTSNSGLVAVTETASSGRILGWAPNQSAWPIASGSWTPVRLGLSSERVAWLGATGARVNDGLYDSAALYSCARPELGGTCQVQKGPDLPITTSSGVLATEGRFITLNGCVASGCTVYLYSWADDALYRVNPAHAGHTLDVIGLSADELFLADSSPTVIGTPDFDGLVRLSLANVADFATRL